ncbi:ATP-binding protein [Streptomyces sp. MUM 178J]|uniref:ATP-binding protein n=1 Tax=Streptomyces sp. MUM 178J TaxID=2791991 RepID=UPI001F03DA35|nr:ATP-binding protein [Streptomyces sp. MUM 178J]WRQ81743.1 ATP-binding protein [Streptomyces sp. MUM 178J]
MKQSAAKTLGVAALGAAFAAAAAGAAAAEPAALPDSATSLDTVTKMLPVGEVAPVQEVASKLPAGANESLAGSGQALADSAMNLPATAEAAATRTLPTDHAHDPVSSLLGPVSQGAGGVPLLGGLPASPLG